MTTLLKLEHIQKIYGTRFGESKVTALENINLEVEQGEFVAIMGESGSGKSTLLNLLAGIDKPTAGKILLNGKEMTKIPEREMARNRRQHIGFVFQEFNLLNTLSLKDNIILPLILDGKKGKMVERKAEQLAVQLGIEKYLNQYPYEVSGGQKQRAAVARAMITEPYIVLADEPTGSLDSKSAAEVLDIFDMMHQLQQTVVMVTHSALAASHASRVIFIRDGKIFHELYRDNVTPELFYQRVLDTLTVVTAGMGGK